MILRDLIAEKRTDILRVAERYGAHHVRLFGSTARHEANEQSDIDFLVEMEPGQSLFDLGGLQVKLES